MKNKTDNNIANSVLKIMKLKMSIKRIKELNS